MERLVDRIYTFKGKVEDVENDYIIKVQEKLKTYEDKQEQGLLIELPCKVGDTVYITGHKYRHGSEEYWINTGKFTYSDFERLGKTVFITRSEAEEALAKMGGK